MSGTTVDTSVTYELGSDGVATLLLDDPQARVNTMNDRFGPAFAAAVEALLADLEQRPDDVRGVVLASGKSTFFAGGDLLSMQRTGPDEAAATFLMVEGLKATMRRLETCGRPVVAAINGAALGGGLELALACHHRVVADDPRIRLGLPEATLGLLPGGGGVTRVTRMLGLQSALMDVLLRGPQMSPEKALGQGLVDEVVPAAGLLEHARAWVLAHPELHVQPWDAPGYRMPGGAPSSRQMAQALPAFPALLRQQTKGHVPPAQAAILSAAVEGAGRDFAAASRIESRYFTSLVTSQTSTNMIQAFFVDMQAVNGPAHRPAGVEPFRPTRVAVLGAGMMGAGIAHACARAGLDVVLKDVSLEAAERGRGYTETLNARAVEKGRTTPEKAAAVLARITPTADAADLAGCDLVIEAVFEDPALKATVFAEVLPHLAPDALLCSNTSTLPITDLAAAVADATGLDLADRFLGLHFFSPVDKMPLVEIIRGRATGDSALAHAHDVVRAIAKTPIIVHDSRGFYTSRVIGVRINEGLAMLAEGVHPVSLERAATQAGYPVGPLQLSDELNMELMARIANATEAADPEAAHPGTAVVRRMIELGRPSRLKGAGFYDYEGGRRQGLWAGLATAFPSTPEEDAVPLRDVADRMLVAEALETARCFEEGVLESSAAANIGSILGIGFPPTTGGAAQLMHGYESPTGEVGLAAFVARADELAAAYGPRFTVPASLRTLAEKGERLPA
ncbi:3-hydroxyacyl-CoA dehydrogenase NAD-binding domain-containing protein [Nocardioides bruguierae]|uniref:3-hydroxyacyl-CoA dehydrogenase NAD-binding domain-containing protein n=1 Tax=Nocardioides bruguierae TaxID=2945102 RepID=UPI00202012F5|nr:3-hydroxyacyl-CoA dehydrogenase NAD-binding domain-containing protein [Nocardioides bruguierae]MCL8024079.1 3-hydroxyacyl-CoA dehydrogenase NAD-binding domain-containing protein [Nocardioides bruguierae]